MMKHVLRAGLLAITIFLAAENAYASFYEQVDVPPSEIFVAAKTVMEPIGIVEENSKKGYLESSWQEDTVERSRGMFRGILKQRYYRRYKFRLYLKPLDDGSKTEVQIRGVFQEKSRGTQASIPWKRVKADASDHRLERELFFRMLSKLESLKRGTSDTPPSEDVSPA